MFMHRQGGEMKILRLEIERCGECPYFRDTNTQAYCCHPKHTGEGILALVLIPEGRRFPLSCPLPDKEDKDNG